MTRIDSLSNQPAGRIARGSTPDRGAPARDLARDSGISDPNSRASTVRGDARPDGATSRAADEVFWSTPRGGAPSARSADAAGGGTLIAWLRAEIDAGTYDSDERVDLAIDALLNSGDLARTDFARRDAADPNPGDPAPGDPAPGDRGRSNAPSRRFDLNA